MPDALIIHQDEGTEIHVQAMTHSGKRYVDIRMWRHGPSGFNPSRSGLMLDLPDLDCLQTAIAQLLKESGGGKQVARVVRDDVEGRRLRGEIEPFGTRYVARFGFWQRVRSSWRAADDGLVLSAEVLPKLQETLAAYRPWLVPVGSNGDEAVNEKEREITRGWPAAGADWVTIEANRVALHPRGARITFTVDENNERQALVRQWRRSESLWIPENSSFVLTPPEVELLLTRLRTLQTSGEDGTALRVPLADGSELRVRIDGPLLKIEERVPGDDTYFAPRITLQLDYLPRLGRALAQCWSLLVDRLPEDERMDMGLSMMPIPAPGIIIPDYSPSEDGQPEVSDVEMPDGEAVLATMSDEPAERAANQDEAEDQDEQPELPGEPELYMHLSEFEVGPHVVVLTLRGTHANPIVTFRWEDHVLGIPLERTEELLEGLRRLYYDALTGHRGQAFTIGDDPVLRASVQNKGMQLELELEQVTDGEVVALHLPAVELPTLLNAAEAALTKT